MKKTKKRLLIWVSLFGVAGTVGFSLVGYNDYQIREAQKLDDTAALIRLGTFCIEESEKSWNGSALLENHCEVLETLKAPSYLIKWRRMELRVCVKELVVQMYGLALCGHKKDIEKELRDLEVRSWSDSEQLFCYKLRDIYMRYSDIAKNQVKELRDEEDEIERKIGTREYWGKIGFIISIILNSIGLVLGTIVVARE